MKKVNIFLGIVLFILSAIQFQFFMKPALAVLASVDNVGRLLISAGFFGKEYFNVYQLQLFVIFGLISIILISFVLIKQKKLDKAVLMIPLIPAVISAIYNLVISISIQQDLLTIILVPLFFLVANFIYYLLLLAISIIVAKSINKTFNHN